jgi:hypothetical protein
LGPILSRRQIEVTDLEDGSQGFTAWGRGTPTRWIEGGSFEAFRDSVATEISDNIGRGNSQFTIYARGRVITIRVLAPVSFETNRFNKIILDDETEDFYRHVGTFESIEVVAERDLYDRNAP